MPIDSLSCLRILQTGEGWVGVMAKIYVSSTYLDLQEYRAQVERVIRRMGHTDVAMEYYVAEDTRPVAKCLADVAACDVYVGIFAWRYGWQPKDDNPENLSITEMEFRQAEKSGKPCLIFLLNEDAPWLPKHIDDDKSKIKNLRNTASAKHNPDWFTTPDELARKVAEAIHKWEKEHGLISSGTLVSFDVQAYYAALRKRYGVLALEGLTPPQKEEYLQIQLRSVFVEQSVRENPPPVELPKEVWEKLSRDKEIHPDDLPSGITLEDVRRAREAYYEKPSRPVLDVLTDSRYQYAIILGDPGSGKSTLARYVMLSLIDPTPTPPSDSPRFAGGEGALPLLIELRSYAGLCADNKCNSFLEFLEYLGKTEGWHLTQAALHNHLKNDGRAVVIFDGLDEIFEPDKREQITLQIVGFCNDYPKARVIVTSRVIGYRRKILTDAGFTHFTLQDLDEKQVETFVNRWYDLAMSDRPDEAKERRERILKSFKESASIRQLAGNPMLLTIMAIIGKHQELPRERWKLYDHAASVLIQHWDVNKHLKDARIDADFIGEDDKKELLRRLAFRMQGGDGGLAGNYIHREQLQAEFEGYLRERYAQTPDRAKVIAEAMIQQFHERNFILSLYGANLYGFVHRAFLEYFCASAFVWKFEKTKELTIEQLKTDVYGKHWEDQSWHEVLRLICGMIDEICAGELITYLATRVNRRWTKVQSNRPPWNIALAVQCLAEVRHLNAVSKSAESLLFAICSLIDKGIPRRSSLGSFLSDQILLPAETIGSAWPHRSRILRNWLRRQKPSDDAKTYDKLFGTLVGSVGQGLEEIKHILFEFARSDDKNFRILAPFALAHGWRSDRQILLLLLDLAANDEHEWVRSDTVVALAAHYQNRADILSFIRNRAINDISESVRSAATYSLAKYFPSDETSALLRTCVMNDRSSLVRLRLLWSIARYFHDDAQTLPLLRDRAVGDLSEFVRGAAVSALAEYYRDNPETLPFLRERAVKDEAPKRGATNEFWGEGAVRGDVIEALVKYWPTHPDTLPLLHERAMKDPTPWLRKRAKKLANAIEQGKSIDDIEDEENEEE